MKIKIVNTKIVTRLDGSKVKIVKILLNGHPQWLTPYDWRRLNIK